MEIQNSDSIRTVLAPSKGNISHRSNRVPLSTLSQNNQLQGPNQSGYQVNQETLKRKSPLEQEENSQNASRPKAFFGQSVTVPVSFSGTLTSNTANNEAAFPFTIYQDDNPSRSQPEVTNDEEMCHVENVFSSVPDVARCGFRQNNDSILTTSPLSCSGEVEVSDDDDVEEVVAISNVDDCPDIFNVDEYTLDIVAHMKNIERRYLCKWNYMSKQPDITFAMRSILVDWLVEVGEEYRLHTETLFLAVNYIDRFLSFMSVQRAKLQLVGTACMFIAAKYEEIYPPEVSEFCYITDNTYTKLQVTRMERLVLDVLGFECSAPTAYFFVNHYAKLSGCPDECEAKFLAQYLSELTLLDAQTYLHFLPSIIGAASVALARHTLGLPAWTTEMVDMTGYAIDDFKECLICLHQTFSKAPESAQQAIREKYKSEKLRKVSEIRPTPIF